MFLWLSAQGSHDLKMVEVEDEQEEEGGEGEWWWWGGGHDMGTSREIMSIGLPCHGTPPLQGASGIQVAHTEKRRKERTKVLQ